MATEYTYDDDCYGDLHKDALGFRPCQSGYELWDAMSPDEKQEQWEYLIREMVRSENEYKAHQQQCVEAFECVVSKTMNAGAKTREEAVRWLFQAADVDGDVGYFCYLNNLPYNYFNEMQMRQD